MGNPILQALQRQQVPAQMSAPNPLNMMQQFQQFRQEMSGKDPQQVVQQLVQSGRMSQQQLNQLQQQAAGLMQFFRR